MKNIINTFYKRQSLLYKVLLYLASVAVIVYLFPKGGKFKYDIQKGKPWQYETLIAPFDFPIYKSLDEITAEKEKITANARAYFSVDETAFDQVEENFTSRFNIFMSDSLAVSHPNIFEFSSRLLSDFYKNGVFSSQNNFKETQIVSLIRNNVEQELLFGDINQPKSLQVYLVRALQNTPYQEFSLPLYDLFFDVVAPNVKFDETFTKQALEESLESISPTRDVVSKGIRIIAKGEVIEGEKFQKLNSLKKEYQSLVWSKSNYTWIVSGYVVLAGLVMLMLLLFLKNYRSAIFENNRKVTFIFVNIILMISLTTLVVKYQVNYIYVVPLCILPLILKAFFDARLGLFAHVLTLLLLGFIVPNSFEYIFLQIIAGIVTILTVSELYKRANLFISVAQITFIYIIGYLAFVIIHEGSPEGITWQTPGFFVLNGLATLFVQPLIYLYEKIFGLVSDVSLLELSDTNTNLLRELSNKAPGTFHHSLQVANLAEAAAVEIGANAMLVRVGALYHDIGKMLHPRYFSENQATSFNPHNELEPQESASIIIGHVIEGIKLARKYKLPDRVIDFIRTHHGTSTVYYFYKNAQALDAEVDEDLYKYPGPKPFSKETSILMMADSVEAASKSLKEPTSILIDEFVERIVERQKDTQQFINANITLQEIEKVKKVLKQKLNNIYHLRVEYPE
ncbi:MAG: HDIG domain-containing protein [Flavobacteriaceae bacterium]|nr:HDIG domain-containing protein [Flavobacteriaceae bacterium]MDG2314213.1 HDIG domain-containing protein [Flavobacteriaceae bacterium]